MTEVILPVVVLGGLGVCFGALLGVAAKVFKSSQDDRAEQIAELLPGANCGGCGYAGCSGLAAAVVKGEASPTACAVLTPETVEKIGGIMGIEIAPRRGVIARVICSGTCDVAAVQCQYDGIESCSAAMRYGGGEKACSYGCLGYGDCVRACKFEAIHLVDGIAQTDITKCTGCGGCAVACPRNLIDLVDSEQRTFVKCRSVEKGAALRNVCTAGCIGCKLCEGVCLTNSIHVTNNLAVIDYDACVNCGLCAEKCPKKVIEYLWQM